MHFPDKHALAMYPTSDEANRGYALSCIFGPRNKKTCLRSYQPGTI